MPTYQRAEKHSCFCRKQYLELTLTSLSSLGQHQQEVYLVTVALELSDQCGLLAPSPDCFANSRDITINGPSKRRPPGGIAAAAESIRFPVPIGDRGTASLWLQVASTFSFPTILGPLLWITYARHPHSHCMAFPLTLNCWRKEQVRPLKVVRLFVGRDTKGDQLWRRCSYAELGSADKMPSSVQRFGEPPWIDITILQPTGVRWPIQS